MGIEHRCGSRTPLNLDVVLHLPRVGPVPAQVLDISIGGMQVRSATRFSVHQPVTVEFAFPRGGPIQRWSAAVTYATDNGGGLMFDNFKSTELAALIELLRLAEDRARALAQSIPPGFPENTDVPTDAPPTRRPNHSNGGDRS
jgi:hypothetical protein